MGNKCCSLKSWRLQKTRGENTNEIRNLNLNFKGIGFFENFELGDTLGKGAYSEVKICTHKATNQKFAVKCVQKENLPEADKADLLEEVRLLQLLKHPNIIDIFQFYREEDRYYFVVLEYMKGGELFDRIVAKQFYTEKEARDLCKILLDAISYCHSLDIVHRDLKPENLLLTGPNDDACIKLADFGFARALNGDLLNLPCGTPAYIAPEILKHKPYDTKVDMWSIGVIIYILLGGYPPFHGGDQTRLFRRIKAGTYKFHEEYWGGISKEATDLIQKLLTVDPSQRLSASDALVHPWILSKDIDLAARTLDNTHERLKLFNARRKLRAAIQSTIAARKFAHFLDLKPL